VNLESGPDHKITTFRKLPTVSKLFVTACLIEHARASTQHCPLNKTVPHPEVESVPRLFLRVDAVGLGPVHGPDVGLMALFEVDELEDRRVMIKIQVIQCIFFRFDSNVTLLTSSPI